MSSKLPGDDGPFYAGNYGLDGYNFDPDYGEAVEDGARLPEVSGISQMPDGIVKALDEEGEWDEGWEAVQDIVDPQKNEFFVVEDDFVGKAAGLVHLDWLEPTQVQDPERLPGDPYTRAKGELEDLWGKSTTGIALSTNNKDLEVVKYELSLEGGPKSGLPGQEPLTRAATLKRVVQKAMRRSHYGEPLGRILKEAAQELGPELAPLAKSAMDQLKKEHGLAGKVFIRASAFPGIMQGKWTKKLKKKARQARYVLVDESSSLAEQDLILGKKVVTKIPWKEAYASYAPELKARGYAVRGGKDYQAALKTAFAQGPKKKAVEHSVKPRMVSPADLVSMKEAQEHLHSLTPTAPKKVTRAALERKKQAKEIRQKLAEWKKAGLLSGDDLVLLRERKVPLETLLKAAAYLISKRSGRATSYKGSGWDSAVPAVASKQEADAALAKAAMERQLAQERVQQARVEKTQREDRKKSVIHVGKMVQSRLLTKDEARSLLDSGQEFRKVKAKAARMVKDKSVHSKSAKTFDPSEFSLQTPLDPALELGSELKVDLIDDVSFGGMEIDL